MARGRRSAIKIVGPQFRLFRLGELARVLDVDPRRVKGWVEQGLIRPTRRGRGPGKSRHFRWQELAWATILLALQSALGQKSPVPPRVLKSVSLDVSGLDLTLAKLLTTGNSPQAEHREWQDGDEIFYVVAYDATRQVHRADMVFERDIPQDLPAFTGSGWTVTMIPLLPFIRPIRERLGLPWPGVERDWDSEDIEEAKWLELSGDQAK
jgi:MerR HTH family regulatory protein